MPWTQVSIRRRLLPDLAGKIVENTGQITFAKLGGKTEEDKLTRLDSIFFWSLLCDIADGNRHLV